MTIAIEPMLAWKLLARVMMAVMCYAYLDVLNWFMTLPPETITFPATALSATVTVAFAVCLGHEKEVFPISRYLAFFQTMRLNDHLSSINHASCKQL